MPCNCLVKVHYFGVFFKKKGRKKPFLLFLEHFGRKYHLLAENSFWHPKNSQNLEELEKSSIS